MRQRFASPISRHYCNVVRNNLYKLINFWKTTLGWLISFFLKIKSPFIYNFNEHLQLTKSDILFGVVEDILIEILTKL